MFDGSQESAALLHATGSVSSKPLTFWIGGQTLLAESLHWIRQINALPGTISDDIWRGSTAARNEAPRALCAQVLVLRNLRVCKASAAAYCKDAAVAYEHIVDPVEGGIKPCKRHMEEQISPLI